MQGAGLWECLQKVEAHLALGPRSPRAPAKEALPLVWVFSRGVNFLFRIPEFITSKLPRMTNLAIHRKNEKKKDRKKKKERT